MASHLMSGEAFGSIKATSAPAVVNEIVDWSKKVMIVQLLQESGRVCDLYCGRGGDIKLFASGKVGGYVGIDSSASAIEAAKENWLKQGTPFEAEFREIDPCLSNLNARIALESLSFDGVSCQGHVQDSFLTETTMRSFLTNVANLLKPGGYFFGTCPDSSIIWVKAQKALQQALQHGQTGPIPKVASKSFQIVFENDKFTTFGCEYSFSLEDGMPAQRQLLVHFPSLIRFAAEVGLHFIDISNLEDFYEYNKSSFGDLLHLPTSTDGKKRIPGYAKELMSIYATFVFRKSNHVIIPPESSPLPVPKTDAPTAAAPERAVSDLSDVEGVKENGFAAHEGSPEVDISSPPKQNVSPLRKLDAPPEMVPPSEKKRRRLRKRGAESANAELQETAAQSAGEAQGIDETPREIAGKTRRGRLRKAGAVQEARREKEEVDKRDEQGAEPKDVAGNEGADAVEPASVLQSGEGEGIAAEGKKGLAKVAVKKGLKKGGLRVDTIKAEEGKRGASESPRGGDTPRRAEGVAILALAAPDESNVNLRKKVGKARTEETKEDGKDEQQNEVAVEGQENEPSPAPQEEPAQKPRVKAAKAKAKAKRQVYEASKYGPGPSFQPALVDFALPEEWFASGKNRRMSIKVPTEEGAPKKVIEARIDELGVRLARAASIEREIEAAQKEAHRKGKSEFVEPDATKGKEKKPGRGRKAAEAVEVAPVKTDEEGANRSQGHALGGQELAAKNDVPALEAKANRKGKGKVGSKGGKKGPAEEPRQEKEKKGADERRETGEFAEKGGESPLDADGHLGKDPSVRREEDKRPNRRNSLRSAGELEERASEQIAGDAFEAVGQEEETPPVVVYKKRLKKKGTKMEVKQGSAPQEEQASLHTVVRTSEQFPSTGDDATPASVLVSVKAEEVERLEARDVAAEGSGAQVAGGKAETGPTAGAGPKLLRRVSTRRGAGEQGELLQIDMDLPSPEYKKRKGGSQRGKIENETKALQRDSEKDGQHEVERSLGDAAQETEGAQRGSGFEPPAAGVREIDKKQTGGESDQREEDAKAEVEGAEMRPVEGMKSLGEDAGGSVADIRAVEKESEQERPVERTAGEMQTKEAGQTEGMEQPAEGVTPETQAEAVSGKEEKAEPKKGVADEVQAEAADVRDERGQPAEQSAAEAREEGIRDIAGQPEMVVSGSGVGSSEEVEEQPSRELRRRGSARKGNG